MILHRPLDHSTLPANALRDAGEEESRFSATWTDTTSLLQAEADHVAGGWRRLGPDRATVYIEVDVPPSAIRLDGGIRANARPVDSHTVAVTVPHAELGELRLISARYRGSGTSDYLPGWQANVRAVALTLKAMRDMERWGAATGQQYRGFAAIGATSTGTALGTGMTRDDALALLAKAAGLDVPIAQPTPERIASAYRKAAARHHPDRGGDPALFARITEARDVLLQAVNR